MKIKVQTKLKLKEGAIVIPLFKENLEKLPAHIPKAAKDFIRKRIENGDFSAEKEQTLFSYIDFKDFKGKIFVDGLGGIADFTPVKARELGGELSKKIKQNKVEDVSLCVGKKLGGFLEEFLEGFLMIHYNPSKFKTQTDEEKKERIKRVDVLIGNKKNKKELVAAVEKAALIVEAADYVKDLVNTPANIVNGEYLAKEAERMAIKNGYKIAILGNKELEKMKAGGILAVNQGSKDEAKLIVLEHDGGKRKEKPIVLIGKGVIFDTGGYNLKPSGSIETMQQDMAGAATVMGIFEILKKLGIKRNVVGVVPVVSNMISETAYRPSDIIKMMNGKTVEVTNTDAEGRLVLADALTYSLELNPAALITMATLTGAVAAALGDRYCGILGNDKDLLERIKTAGDEVDDLMWELPIHEDFKKKLESEVADYRNYDPGTGRLAGTAKAAAFLENFVEKNSWVHMDTGGTAFTENPKPYEHKGATAQGLRAILKFLQKDAFS